MSGHEETGEASGTLVAFVMAVLIPVFTAVFWLLYEIGAQHQEAEREISRLTAYIERVQARADRTDRALQKFKEPGRRFSGADGDDLGKEIRNVEERIGRVEKYLYDGWRVPDRWEKGG